MAYSSPSSSRICSMCSGVSSSCFCSSCECSSEQSTVSQNSTVATPTCSFDSFLLSNYRSPFNSIDDNELITNEFPSLDGSIQISTVSGIDSVDDNTTHMDSIPDENRIEDFKTENISEEEQGAQTEELFVIEEIPDGVVLGQEEIWIPPAQSQDVENVFAMENSVPYETAIPCTPPYDRRLFLIQKIEEITHGFLDDLVNNRELKITHIKKTEWSNCNLIDNVVKLKKKSNATCRTVKFERVRSQSNFTIFFYLLSEIHKLLVTKSTCSRRELYYHKLGLVKNITKLNFVLGEICVFLEATPWELGVLSTSKGLMAGSVYITTSEDQTIDCKLIHGGILLPPNENGIKTIRTNAKFVLIVEKDTVYHRLLDDKVFNKIDAQFILITGKGYPDISTRLMVKRIWNEFKLPTYALVDADPYGIEIMCTYRFGSLSMSHNSDNLAVPSIHWLGILPSDVSKLCIPTAQLTVDDKSKIKDILKRPYISEDILKEINILSELNEKAEIESLANLSPNYLIDTYLPYKFKIDPFV